MTGLLMLGATGCRNSDQDDRLPADYVGAAYGDLGGGKPVDADAARLVGPHFEVRYTSGEVSDHTNDYRYAAKGYELVTLYAELDLIPPRFATADSVPKAVIVVDGVRRELPQVPYLGVSASVPLGHDAYLQITDEARTQSLNLRTGERGTDAIEAYYRPQRVSFTPSSYQGSAASRYRAARLVATVTVSLGDNGGTLEPWLPDIGWAAKGHLWLYIPKADVQGRVYTDNAREIDDRLLLATLLTFQYVPDRVAMFALTYAGGRSAPLPRPAASALITSQPLLFEVPESISSGTLVVDPVEHLKADYATAPITWTRRFPTTALAWTLTS